MSEAYDSSIVTLREEFVEVSKSVFGESLVAIIAKGSTVKGGFIPGLSDVDLHVYLKNDAFIYNGFLKVDLGLSMQAEMDRLIRKHDVGGSPIQVILINESQLPDWSGPLPGTYLLLYGDRCPESPPTAEGMLAQDLEGLKNPTYAYKLIGSFADKSDDYLVDYVRRLNPAVTPTLYRVLSLLSQAPLKIWKMTKFEVLEALEKSDDASATQLAKMGREFYALASQNDRLRKEPNFCRVAIRAGFRVIDTGRDIGLRVEAEKGKALLELPQEA